MITYVEGDIFAKMPCNKLNTTIFLPHIVNNISRMGSGFVVPLIKKYPKVYTEYMARPLHLGESQFVQVESTDNSEIIVANMVAQKGIISSYNPKPINYQSLFNCMEEVAEYNCLYPNKEIHAPMFGAARAGADWSVIEKQIERIWSKFPVFIYKLDDGFKRPS